MKQDKQDSLFPLARSQGRMNHCFSTSVYGEAERVRFLFKVLWVIAGGQKLNASSEADAIQLFYGFKVTAMSCGVDVVCFVSVPSIPSNL
jgi:hypothetical protein